MTLLVATRPNLNLRVKEADGTPDVPGVSVVVVSNGTLTNDGGGQVTLNTGGTTLPVVDETALVFKTGSPAITATFDANSLTVARTYTLPNASTTLAGLAVANTFTAAQTFSAGLSSYTNGVTSNFVAGGAGNATMTGVSNFIVGSSAGANMTNGIRNTLINNFAGNNLSTGSNQNFFLGFQTGFYARFSCSENTVIGTSAFGVGAGGVFDSAIGNTIIGHQAGFSLGAGDSYNVHLGFQAGFSNTTSNRLYIANSNTATPLIYGEFDNGILKFHSTVNSDAVVNTLSLVRRRGTGTPGAGLGSALRLGLHSSTTEDQDGGRVVALWNDATHASRKADLVGYASDFGGEREIWRGRAGGTAPAIAFLGATPVPRAAHIADPAGGGVVDTEARTAINAILVVLENLGFNATS